MSFEVYTKVRGIDKLEKFLRKLPYGAKKIALKAFAEYVVGNERHGLRHDEPQRYISRARAGYKTSQAQMRYFFAVGILENVGGKIVLNHYKRTGETAAAWNYHAVNEWQYRLVNPKIGAYYTRDNDGQTRQHALAGRRTVARVVADNFKSAIRHAQAAINKWLKGK